MENYDTSEGVFEEVERRAFMDLPEEDEEPEMDVVAALGESGPEVDASAQDMTLGGYIELHTRPPAFGGEDEQPYTVDIDIEETDDPERPYAAFLVFLRWAETGAGIMEHTESGDIAFGSTPEAARAAALELTLYEIKAELDAAIARKKHELEE